LADKTFCFIFVSELKQTIMVHLGYFLHKDGTPVVVESSEKVVDELKKNGYWKNVKFLRSEGDIKKHLSTYNAGFRTNRTNLKPFFSLS